jgi:hypothetical protein
VSVERHSGAAGHAKHQGISNATGVSFGVVELIENSRGNQISSWLAQAVASERCGEFSACGSRNDALFGQWRHILDS